MITSTLRSLTILSLLATFGCEGGEIYIIDNREDRLTGGYLSAPNTPAGEVPTGGEVAGEAPAGMPPGGEPAGMPPGGERAGMPPGGEPAGTPEVECGLLTPESRVEFSEGPLTLFATTCASGGGCHLNNRRFSLSFNAPEGPTFSPAQIDEGLTAVEPFITIGASEMSQIVGRVIDNHARALNINEQSPEYLALTAWIDSLTPCD